MLFQRLCQVPHRALQTQRTNAIFVLWQFISYYKHQRMIDEAMIFFVFRSCVHIFYCVHYGSLWKSSRKKYAKTIKTPGRLFPFGLFHCLNEEKEERILLYSMNLILCTFGKWPRCPGKITQMALVLCSSITSFPGGSVVSLVAQRIKRLPAMWETRVRSLGWEDPLEKEMATHSSTLAWRIPWTEEPGRLQSMGSQRVGHDWATSLCQCRRCRRPGFNPWVGTIPGVGNGNPLVFLPGKIPQTAEPSGPQSIGSRKSQTWLSTQAQQHHQEQINFSNIPHSHLLRISFYLSPTLQPFKSEIIRENL